MNRNHRIGKIVLLIVFGLIVHLLVLKAAFDIYFSSPIDHGMTPIKTSSDPPAKRLVLIVADGLRAEAIYEKNQDVAPNLRKIRETRGSWGIATTRVPTESRPGHVALLAGIYEDPSAILQGWKVNPVDFDSVINQSTNAWCWGGPSIINMFNRDGSPHIHLHSYDSQMEDFGTNNTLLLDSWVFDKVKMFVQGQKDCQICSREFRQSGNLFFLHLLGIDTAGHAYKPESAEYKKNIQFVDQHIPIIEKLFENAFPDNSTAYIFAADHGMTNWGSHGAGSHHETKTPLIAWGAGVKVDRSEKDISQVDIAPLMSALIGINIPINSVGILPYNFINTTRANLFEMMFANVRQLMEIFNIKRLRTEKNAINFVPFQDVTSQYLDEKLTSLNRLAQRKDTEYFIKEAEDLMYLLIEGADYYHNYYQLPLLISITVGLFAWIIFLATFDIDPCMYSRSTPISTFMIKFSLLFGVIYLSALFLLGVQSLPFMYYAYFLFPIVMIQILVLHYQNVNGTLKLIKRNDVANFINNLMTFGSGLIFLVQSFHYREALGVVMFFLSITVWFAESRRREELLKRRFAWMICCSFLGVFAFLPVMKTTFNIPLYAAGCGVWWALNDYIIRRLLHNPFYSMSSIKTIKVQHLMFKMTPMYTIAVELGYVTPSSNLKYVAWIWAIYPMILIFRTSPHIFVKQTSIYCGFIVFYAMVSCNYEIMFLVAYMFLLLCWIVVESHVFDNENTLFRTTFTLQLPSDNRRSVDEYRRAFIFITLIFIGFFGTGNIASLNSFDPMWVRCFLTIFSPFKMAGLILLRITVPFIFASCALRAINILHRTNTLRMFSIILMYSDLMLLVLLYSITNIGSWLEIGTSLSHFIIMEAFVLILILLYGFAYFLTTFNFTLPILNIIQFFNRKLDIIIVCCLASLATISYTIYMYTYMN